MTRCTLRICLVGGLVALFVAASLRTPGLWHAHIGGDVAHRHGNAPYVPHASNAHGPPGHSHSHSRMAHRHAHVGHRHTHRKAHPTARAIPAAQTAPPDSQAERDTNAGNSTWHVHFSLFGFEWTHWSKPPAGAAKPSVAMATGIQYKSSWRSLTTDLVASPAGMAFRDDPASNATRLLALESGPLPNKVGFPRSDDSRPLSAVPISLTGRDAAPPPLPPPRGDRHEISCRVGS